MSGRAGRATSLVALLGALTLIAWPAHAQQGGYRLVIDQGIDVRLTTRGESGTRIAGRAGGVRADTLLLAESSGAITRRFLLRDLSSLEIRGGRNRRRGATIGAILGATITGIAGGIDVSKNASSAPDDRISIGEVIGAAVGNAAIGGLIGYALAPGGWERLPLPMP
ncbi:MAG: hypothetical protein JWL60_98 [Gemmatimonadetes bacterium]|jgi:hypothetical protein|nr:hypothetical protein [Gemmatimonadota bacterium]